MKITREMLWADSGETPLAGVVAHSDENRYYVYSRRADGIWQMIANCGEDPDAAREWWLHRIDPIPFPADASVSIWLEQAHAGLTQGRTPDTHTITV